MSEERTGMGQRAKSLVEQAKRGVGVGDPPLATETGGRAKGMSEALRAFGEGDIDRFLSAFADDVEWSGPKGDGFPGAGNHQGRDAVREAFVGDAERSYTSFGFRPDRYLESPAENVVVALGAFTGEGVKGSGQLDAPGRPGVGVRRRRGRVRRHLHRLGGVSRRRDGEGAAGARGGQGRRGDEDEEDDAA